MFQVYNRSDVISLHSTQSYYKIWAIFLVYCCCSVHSRWVPWNTQTVHCSDAGWYCDLCVVDMHKHRMKKWTHGTLSDPMELCHWIIHFSSLSFSATDKNECLNPALCSPTARCKNTRGSYLCVCNPGFETPDGGTQFTDSGGTCISKQIPWCLRVKIFRGKELR